MSDTFHDACGLLHIFSLCYYYRTFFKISSISSTCSFSITSGGTRRSTFPFALIIRSPSFSASELISPTGFLTLIPWISPIPRLSRTASFAATSSSSFFCQIRANLTHMSCEIIFFQITPASWQLLHTPADFHHKLFRDLPAQENILPLLLSWQMLLPELHFQLLLPSS